MPLLCKRCDEGQALLARLGTLRNPNDTVKTYVKTPLSCVPASFSLSRCVLPYHVIYIRAAHVRGAENLRHDNVRPTLHANCPYLPMSSVQNDVPKARGCSILIIDEGTIFMGHLKPGDTIMTVFN